jgi:tetratricopeptide (TPR) repeat protein
MRLRWLLILLAGTGIVLPGGTESISAEEHFARARQAMARHDLNAAESDLRHAIAVAPQNPEYVATLGVVLGMEQKLQESDSYFERALHLDPRDSATRRNLAWNQFELGELDSAKSNLNVILKQREDPQAVLLLGMVYEELRDYPRAIRILETVPGLVRQRPESMAALARAYYYTDRKPKAREILKELQSRSNDPDGVFLGGQVAAELHEFDTAELLFTSIGRTYSDKAKLGYNLAMVQYRAGQYRGTESTLKRLVESGHESSEIYNLLAWCFYKQDDFKAAASTLDKAIALEPSDETNYLDGGMMLVEHHLLEGALDAAEKALEVAPDSYRAHRLKALAEFKLGRMNDAEQMYARSVALNPADPEAIAGLATTQADKGDTRVAEETLKKGIERLPRAAVLYQAYGAMLLWGGRTDNASDEARAISLFQTAAAIEPSLPEPHYQLGKLALRGDRIRDALRELEMAARLDPKSSKNHYGLAQVYRKLGRTADAARETQLFQSLRVKEERLFSSAAAAQGNATQGSQRPRTSKE